MLIAQRWILAALRHHTFFSLEELNLAIGELLEELNARPFQKLEGCRRSAFEAIDRPAMRALPAPLRDRRVAARLQVNVDYCITFEHRIWRAVRAGRRGGRDPRDRRRRRDPSQGQVRIASHARCFGPKGTSVIADEHRPRAHRDYGRWPPERMVAGAESVGPLVGAVATAIMRHRTHPETGVPRMPRFEVRLADRYGRERVDVACARALAIGSPSFKSVAAILKNGLDRTPPVETSAHTPIAHEHIRGTSYFNKEDDGDLGRDNSEATRHEDARDGGDAARDEHHPTDRTTSPLRRPIGLLIDREWAERENKRLKPSTPQGCPSPERRLRRGGLVRARARRRQVARALSRVVSVGARETERHRHGRDRRGKELPRRRARSSRVPSRISRALRAYAPAPAAARDRARLTARTRTRSRGSPRSTSWSSTTSCSRR